MPPIEEVTDPSDWLPTNLSFFAPLDSALRCQVCKEFYNTPMITSCSHTFCSLCIRRCLSTDGKCPACRQTDQPSKLRVNGTVQELVDAFGAARPQGLKLGLKPKQEAGEEEEVQPRRKRRRVDRQEQDASSTRQTRQTRSSGRRTNGVAPSQDIMILDSEDDDVEDYHPEPEPKEPDDGLVACPMCETRMKEPLVYAHLDRCDGKVAPKSRRPKTPPLKPPKSIIIPASPAKHLPHLNYSLLKDNPLRKKLQEIGIPAWGARQLLIRRHTQWVDIFNANSDSPRPRPNRELLKDLDTWERTQGGHAPGQGQTGPQGVMKKDFDGEAWTRRHKERSKGYAGFDDLIASARAKVKNAKDKAEEHAAEKPASEIRPSEASPIITNSPPIPIPTQLSDMEQLKAEQQAIAAQTKPITTTSTTEPTPGAAVFFQHAAEDIPMRDPTPSPGFNAPLSSQNERRTAHQERRYSNPQPPSQSQSQNAPNSSFQNHTPAGSPPISSIQIEDSLDNKFAHPSREETLGSPERARRVPMFWVPEESVKDNEGFGAAAG